METTQPLRDAALSLGEHLREQSWFAGAGIIGEQEPQLVIYTAGKMSAKALETMPASWQGFPVQAQVMGSLSPIGTRSATSRNTIQKSRLEGLEPGIITEHLKAANWTLIGHWEGKKASVWAMGEERIVVPSSQHFGDYSQRVSEVIDTLSQVEGRTLDEVWHDLAGAKATTID